jgi:hypothetical protein
MNSRKMNRGNPVNIRKAVDESDFQDLLVYLMHRIHRPTHNVYTQYLKKLSGKEYNWWKENQLLI